MDEIKVVTKYLSTLHAKLATYLSAETSSKSLLLFPSNLHLDKITTAPPQVRSLVQTEARWIESDVP